MKVDICIVTYRRPQGLTRLLGAIQELHLPDPAPELRVVVVDNDPEASARPVCEQAREWLPFALEYTVEKRRGIPQARNAAISAAAAAGAEYVAFLDDDEVPDECWLEELLHIQQRHAADAVGGPVLSLFEERPPAWVEQGGFFVRPRHPDGSTVHVAFTGNVLIRVEALAAMETLFDERMALTGGSDAEFFRRFHASGHKIVWADAAIVHEVVPPSRVSLAWLLRRSLRVGTATAFIDRNHRPGAVPALRMALHAGWCVAKGSVLLAASVFRGKPAAVHALRLAVFGLARFAGLAGYHYREYATTHGS